MSTDPIDEASQHARQALIAISETIRHIAASQARRNEERARTAATQAARLRAPEPYRRQIFRRDDTLDGPSGSESRRGMRVQR